MRDVQFNGVTLCMSANAVAYSTFRTQLLYLDDESPTKAGVKHHNINLRACSARTVRNNALICSSLV